MAARPSLLALRGELVVVGKQPDGDSIRFVPDSPALLRRLRRADRVRVSSDGSVQLRLDGIDAPETHYGALAQPLGAPARDRLLALCGFADVERDGETVTAARPERRPAAALAHLSDPNGRPVCFVVAGDERPADGEWAEVDDALLRRTVNVALLEDGSAYATLYDALAADLRDALRAVAAAARERGAGVWARDQTAAFTLIDQASIGPDGALVLPKLFRRCSDYLRTGTADESLAAWLRADADARDDEVLLPGRRTRLSALIDQAGPEISFPADPLELVFIER
jgi:endonuclease YncB( thermonuclease family)